MHHRYKFKMYKEIDKFHQDLKCLQYIHVLNYHTVYLKLESESCSIMSNSLWPHGLYSPWNSPSQNTGVGSHSLLQGILPIQESQPGLPYFMWILYHLSHQGSPFYIHTHKYVYTQTHYWYILKSESQIILILF